jgi:hypothetical protein
MRNVCLLFLTVVWVFSSMGFLGADVHVKSETSRLYMDFERKDVYELWLTEGKSYSKVRNRIVITREDLGVRWYIEPARKTYMEIKLEEGSGTREEEPEDIHTVGMYYSPEYDWEVEDTGEEKVINGFRCRLFSAVGDADFADLKAKYWVCLGKNSKGGLEYGNYMKDQLKDDPQRPRLHDILSKHKGSFPVYREENIENAIAPTMVYKIRLLELQEAEAPAGIYDLPEAFKKMER